MSELIMDELSGARDQLDIISELDLNFLTEEDNCKHFLLSGFQSMLLPVLHI